MTGEPQGLAVLDKPEGMTSHDVVSAMRRALRIRRVGHAGTLDPPATGVLLVGVGRSTRLLRFLVGTDKAYEGTLALGSTTTTLDATGEVTATFDLGGVTEDAVRDAARSLTGELAQRPPMVSAVHVDGRRLHELAREGVEVERAARPVRVERFDVHPLGAEAWRFEVVCSSGTYVRSLVDDLGQELGCGAHVTALRRTRSGTFTIADAVPLAQATADAAAARATLRDPIEMVAHLGVVDVTSDQAADLTAGRRAKVADGEAKEVAVRADGALVCVARREADGTLRPLVVVGTGPTKRDE